MLLSERSITVVVEASLENNYPVSLLHDMHAIKPEGGIDYQNRFRLQKISDNNDDTEKIKLKDVSKKENEKDENADKKAKISRKPLIQRLCPCLS